MTKNFKLVMALALVAMMLLTMVPAMAAGGSTPTGSIQITYTGTNIPTNHTFSAYQVFSGTLSNNGSKLSDIDWGEGVDASAMMTELKKVAAYASCTTAEDVANVLKGFSNDSAELKAFNAIVAKNLVSGKAKPATNGKIENLPVGYYFIEDTTTLATDKPDAKSAYILQVLGTVSPLVIKTDAPSIDKKVKNNGEPDTAYREGNTAAIGDTVNYEITATIPEMANYDQYYYIVTDTLSGGLTYDASTLSIKIAKEGEEDITVPNTAYTVTLTPSTPVKGTATKIEIVFKNFIQYKNYGEVKDGEGNITTAGTDLAGRNVVIDYNAVLNDKATIGATGNPNDVDLTYSNNPNKKGEGTDKPTDDEKDKVTGVTPQQHTITYTANLKLVKVDDSTPEQPLQGVKFQLKGFKKNNKITYTEVFEQDNANGEYWKLKPVASSTDPTYTTKAPTSLTKGDYASETDKYKKVVKQDTTPDATAVEPFTIEGTTDASGFIDFGALLAANDEDYDKKSFAEGTYVLTELETLDGYTLLEEAVTIKLNSDADEKAATLGTETTTWSIEGSDSGVTLDNTTGLVTIKVVNKSGLTLPSTGGVGTTIFYVAGSLMVLAAAILLITKRRMGAND